MRLGIGRVRSTQPLKYATFASLCKEEGGLSDLSLQRRTIRVYRLSSFGVSRRAGSGLVKDGRGQSREYR